MGSSSDGVSLLDRAYSDLDLTGGSLHEASPTPPADLDPETWSELGEWLMLASRVGAERVFFVNNDPVLVFSSLPAGTDERRVLSLYRRTWSLARPRCLFLSVGGELRVYVLSRPPAAPWRPEERSLDPLWTVSRASDVAEVLAIFHRERLESGAAFEDPKLSELSGRADRQLLEDVETAASALVHQGLAFSLAHSLIERAILIRYLEDRGVLTEEYFSEVVQHKVDFRDRWVPPNYGQPSQFLRCLTDKKGTYELFEKLSRDFNGDLFVQERGEEHAVSEVHLRLLRDLLAGTSTSTQEPLFLWAYDFSVVPTSLVSTMYELFYNQEQSEDRETSTYYTPPQLVEFVLGDVLTADTLDAEPTVCDPACGSGIFLVEAYRRIVRHESAKVGRSLSNGRLRQLLLERIAGCDLDRSAVRLAAFSLYVAFLNYQSPQDIRRAGPLPRLIRDSADGEGAEAAPLVVGDAFATEEHALAPAKRQGLPPSRWPRGFDIVVGNPPWTEPRKRRPSLAEEWARQRGLPVGDRSPSQLFLWRTLDLLSARGVASQLVSAKAMLNSRTTAKAFRARWLEAARVERVVNFSAVRQDFFKGAVAPFMLVRFRRGDGSPVGPVVYETARPVPGGRRGSPALGLFDRRIVSQASLRNRDYLWKAYSAGSDKDDALLARLDFEDRLREFLSPDAPPGYGFQLARQGGRPPSEHLRGLRVLNTFESWGPLRDDWFEPPPTKVKRDPNPRLYHGQRLIVRRGVTPGFGPQARLESESFAFRHQIYAIPLSHMTPCDAKLILGTLLSSLGRYWLYMVSGSWGTWKDEVRSEVILDLPVRILPQSDAIAQRIVKVVDRLTSQETGGSGAGVASWTGGALYELDEAVSDLFDLTHAERDLVADFWLGQRPDASASVPIQHPSHGTAADLDHPGAGMDRYLSTFLDAWNYRVGTEAEFGWRVFRQEKSRVIAVVFDARERGRGAPDGDASSESASWQAPLERIGRRFTAGSLLAHGIIRAVSDTDIVVVKRDEQRMWTATAAREDSDATALQVLALAGT